MDFLPRGIERRLRARLQREPLLILEGARATGKSRLLEHGMHEKFLTAVRSFIDPTELAAAKAAPRDYVFGLPHGTAIDEAQLCEEITLPIKELIEQAPPGALILTGSTRLRRNALGGSDPFAGRVGSALALGPLTLGERGGAPVQIVDQLFDAEPGEITIGQSVSRADLGRFSETPGLPGIRTLPVGAERRDRSTAYLPSVTNLQAFASRDVQRLNKLARFLAGRTSTLVNISSFSTATEITRPTVEEYLALLEEALLVRRLRGWRRSKDKSETDRAKLHFFDTGIAAALSQMDPVTRPEDLGRLAESLLINDLLYQAEWLDEPPTPFHWRRDQNHEVDLILESIDHRAVCVEVKAAEQVSTKDFRGIDAFRRAHPDSFHRGFVFYTGASVLPFGEDRWAIPFGALLPDGPSDQADPVDAVIAAVRTSRGGSRPHKTFENDELHLLYQHEISRQLKRLGESFTGYETAVEMTSADNRDWEALLFVDRPAPEDSDEVRRWTIVGATLKKGEDELYVSVLSNDLKETITSFEANLEKEAPALTVADALAARTDEIANALIAIDKLD